MHLPYTHACTHKYPALCERSAIVIQLQRPAYFSRVQDFIWNMYLAASINVIFQPYKSFKPPSSTKGDGYITLSWMKFNAEQLLFEGFLDGVRIFRSIEP